MADASTLIGVSASTTLPLLFRVHSITPIGWLCADIGVVAGTLNISVAYQGLPIYSEVRDLCDMTTCPIQKGDLLIAYDQYLPPIVPPVRSMPPPRIGHVFDMPTRLHMMLQSSRSTVDHG